MDFEEALTAAQTVNADLSPIPSPVSNVLHKLEKVYILKQLFTLFF